MMPYVRYSSSRASHGAWSSKGCKVVQENNSSVSCQCNHLTSFAVLTRILPQKVCATISSLSSLFFIIYHLVGDWAG